MHETLICGKGKRLTRYVHRESEQPPKQDHNVPVIERERRAPLKDTANNVFGTRYGTWDEIGVIASHRLQNHLLHRAEKEKRLYRASA